TYDPKRKVSWFFASVGSGPYAPAPPHGPGYYTYNLEKDVFTLTPIKDNGVATGQNCFMAISPDHDLAIFPNTKATDVFDLNGASWSGKPWPDCPGPMYVYQRLAYLDSKKAYLRIAETPTGKTSESKPADALAPEEAAGKAFNFWVQDPNLK